MTETPDAQAENLEEPAAESSVDTPADGTATETTETTDADETEVENPAAAAKGRENSKLRERLRDVTARLETMQRREVERIASQHLADGADFWRDGAEIAQVLDSDGNIDNSKVETMAKEILANHRHWRKASLAAPPASVVTANGSIGDGDTRPTFTDAFRPRNG